MILKNILLIDDERDIRTVACLSLQRIGKFDVISAESGEEGLGKARSEKPDLILLDMMMPGMDGLEVLQKLQDDSDTKDIPVIFMTARVQAHERETYLAHGVCGVIEKPFDPLSLPRDIQNILQSRVLCEV